MAKADAQHRWHQIPIVWMVIGIPLFSIVFTLSIVWISVRTYDGVVVDDYYRKGLEINRDLARDRYAGENNLQASAVIEGSQLHIRLTSDADQLWPPALEVGFYHPTVSNRDVVVNLKHRGSGRYSSGAPEIRFGKWNVITGTDSWRLEGTLFHPDEDGFMLSPVKLIDADR